MKFMIWTSLNSSKTTHKCSIKKFFSPFSFHSNKWSTAKIFSLYKKLLLSDVISTICISANLLKQKEKLPTNKIKLIAIFAGAHFHRKFMMIIHHSEAVAFSLSFILFFLFCFFRFIICFLCLSLKIRLCECLCKPQTFLFFFAFDSLGYWQSKNKRALLEMRSISKYKMVEFNIKM